MSVTTYFSTCRAEPGTEQALIYPGLGLGTILSKSKMMTDKMIVAGAKRLGELAPALKDPDQGLLPDFGGQSNSAELKTVYVRSI